MNTILWCAAVCAVAFASTSTAEDKKDEKKLPEALAKALEKAGELELYSIDGEAKDKGDWHGWKVLGKTTVKGDAAKKVAGAVTKGVADGDNAARCFIPRHGVRVTHDKTTYDLVICFECSWVYVYSGEDKVQKFPTTAAAEKAINEALTAAKVPLAKPEK